MWVPFSVSLSKQAAHLREEDAGEAAHGAADDGLEEAGHPSHEIQGRGAGLALEKVLRLGQEEAEAQRHQARKDAQPCC